MGQPVVIVDAFSDVPFAGNPAAVCLLEAPREEAWLQRVAAELNLSETAFVLREEEQVRLRWFTPAVEVDLCGHATLATSHVLWTQGGIDPSEPLSFETLSGTLHARRRGALIEVDLPARPGAPVAAPPGLAAALGAEPREVVACPGAELLVLLEGADVVRGLKPDLAALGRLDAAAVCVTAPSDMADFDIVSRFFAPSLGIDEDPVTGAAHCCLGPFWAPRLGKTELRAFQASARGGVVQVRLDGDRVILGGHAVTVVRGIIDA